MRRWRRSFEGWLAALFALSPAVPAIAGTGGPDKFGYVWLDQAEPGVDATLPTPTGPGAAIPIQSNEISAPVDLGFAFPFYGGSYSQFVFSDNGWISFDTTIGGAYRAPNFIPHTWPPSALIAWYWRELIYPATSVTLYPFDTGAEISIQTRIAGSSKEIAVTVVLYRSGRIKIVYGSVDKPETTSIGIENAAGDDGLNPWHLGTGDFGFTSGSVLEFDPPPALDCGGAVPLACGQTVTSASPAALAENVFDYPCSPAGHFGNERVFTFTLAELSDVTLTLQNVGGRSLDLFVLRQGTCNEFRCLTTGSPTVTLPWLAAGTYEVVVDGLSAQDNGPITLAATCIGKSAPLACQPPGAPPVAGQTAGSSRWSNYPCVNQTMSGPEFIYQVQFTAPGNLRATLIPEPGAELDLLAFGPDEFGAPEACQAWGDDGVSLFDPPSGTYYLVVDGRTKPGKADVGKFQIGLTCGIQLDCGAPDGDLSCFMKTDGTTAGAPNRAQYYSCSTAVEDGGERVYRFHNDVERTVSFLFEGDPDLTLFVASSCNEGACVDHGDGRLFGRRLAVGDYWLVVDGRNGASGAFAITPVCGNRVTPDTAVFELEAGQAVHETKDLFVNTDISKGDVVFAMDLTGSMSGYLANVKKTARKVVGELSSRVDDVQFGLVSFEDYPAKYDLCGRGSTYGGGSDRPYRLNLPITSNLAALDAAILGLPPGQGGDGPESYLRTLFEMYADTQKIGWRPGARRIMVMFGDNLPHVCSSLPCIEPEVVTGVDPGRDGVQGTADDLDMATVQAELLRRGITPIFLDANQNGDVVAPWDCWNQLGGGHAFSAPLGIAEGNLVDDLRKLIEEKWLICEKLEPRVEPAAFASWISNLTPVSLRADLPAHLNFDFDVVPPPGTAPGVYDFEVQFLCDGVVKTVQQVEVRVVACRAPSGAVGNHLKGVRQASDVVLDWRDGVLGPRRYNVHRLTDKTGLPLPRTDPPLRPETDAEKDTDAGVVPLLPRLYFYDVWGRDCAGGSIFQ